MIGLEVHIIDGFGSLSAKDGWDQVLSLRFSYFGLRLRAYYLGLGSLVFLGGVILVAVLALVFFVVTLFGLLLLFLLAFLLLLVGQLLLVKDDGCLGLEQLDEGSADDVLQQH